MKQRWHLTLIPCFRLAAMTLACALLASSPLRAYQGIDVDQLRKNIDSAIAQARQYINDPDVLTDILMERLRPIGDDPRVLSFCGEVVDKSTNTLSLHHAVGTLGSIAPYYFADKKQVQMIERIVLKASRKGDEMVQLDSYNVLSSLGGHYKQEAHEGYRRILAAKYLAQNEKRHKNTCVFTIRYFLKSSPLDAADIAAIRKVTDRLDLLSYYKKEVFNRDSKSAEQSSQRFLDQWLAILDSKVAPKQ